LSVFASVFAVILLVTPSSVTACATTNNVNYAFLGRSSAFVAPAVVVSGTTSSRSSSSSATCLHMGLRSFIKNKILRRGETTTTTVDKPKPKLLSKPTTKAAAPAPAKKEAAAPAPATDFPRPDVGTKVKVVSDEPIVLKYVNDGLDIVGLTGTVVHSKPIIVEFTEPENFKAYLAVSQVQEE